jgi:DNA-binding protein H-NS
MDLSTLSVSELRDLQQQIPLELKRREAQDKVNILNEVRAFAKARGYALEELVTKNQKLKSRQEIKLRLNTVIQRMVLLNGLVVAVNRNGLKLGW